MKPLMFSLAAFGVVLSSHAAEATKEIARRAFDFGPEVRGTGVVREGADGKLAAVCEGFESKERTYKTWEEVPESVRRYMPGKARAETVVTNVISKFEASVDKARIIEKEEDLNEQTASRVPYMTEKNDFPLSQIEVFVYHDSHFEIKTTQASRSERKAEFDSSVAGAKAKVSANSKTEISSSLGYRNPVGVLTFWVNKRREIVAIQSVESVHPVSTKVTMEGLAGGLFDMMKTVATETLNQSAAAVSAEAAPAPASPEKAKP